jgi:cellobiose transport system permease protein
VTTIHRPAAPTVTRVGAHAAPARRRRGPWRFWPQYLAISPFYVLFAVFGLFPMLFSLYLAFQRWDGFGDMEYVGLDNFKYLVEDDTFWQSLRNTVIIWLLSTVPMLCLALVIAAMLNSAVRFRGFYRVAYFVPNVTSVVAMALFFGAVFASNFGLANAVLHWLHLPEVRWLSDPWGIKIAIAAVGTWQWTGYNAIIYLAGLQAIPGDLYEAAKVDGAGPVQSFFRITPNTGGPGQEGLTMVLYFYHQAFDNNDFGYAAAISWAVFMIILLFAVINWRLVQRRGE